MEGGRYIIPGLFQEVSHHHRSFSLQVWHGSLLWHPYNLLSSLSLVDFLGYMVPTRLSIAVMEGDKREEVGALKRTKLEKETTKLIS